MAHSAPMEEDSSILDSSAEVEQQQQHPQEQRILGEQAAPGGQAWRYHLEGKLGKGSFAHVYKAWDLERRIFVALKKVQLSGDEGIPCTSVREISVATTLQHPNVIRQLDVFFQRSKLYVVLELMDEDLHHFLSKRRRLETPLSPSMQKEFQHQILSAIEYCHAHGVMHRDLKPQNILLLAHNGTWILKVADFGLARAVQLPVKTYTHEVMTLWYRAPEILLWASKYGLGVDLWSAGCIMAEITTLKPLFTGESEIGQLFQIFQVRGTPTEATWPGVSALRDYTTGFPSWSPKPLQTIVPLEEDGLRLLQGLLTYNPKMRLSAKKALQHAYFDGLSASSSSSSNNNNMGGGHHRQ